MNYYRLSLANCLGIKAKIGNNLCFAAASYLLLNLGVSASAQIIPDNTLPNNSQVNQNGNLIEILQGTTAGTNLFHSFEQFSLIQGKTAWFQNATTIENILTRVTGNSISNIDGLIRANGSANLFLINPNGLIFGPNATLDIGGSFVGSTADSLKFADGNEFSAINPQEQPLLTVSIPVGLQYGSNAGNINAGNIIVEGAPNNLVVDPVFFSIDRSNRPEGLKVADGKTLALVGQDIRFSGGNITAREGNIKLWAVNNGLVSIVDLNGQLQIPTEQESLTYGNIELSQAASVDASGNSGGAIQLRGQNISVKDGSVILTDTLGTGSGGNLEVRATESLKVSGISPFSDIFSSLLADVASGATGSGGNILIETDSLQITEGGQISSGTFGLGNAGSLTVKTQNIKISGGSMFSPSGLFTPVALGARGHGGDLNIETSSLEVTNAGQIASVTLGFGNGGNITIKADDLVVSRSNEFGPSNIDASVFKLPGMPEDIATFFGAGVGNGGNLTIETNSLRVADGAQIAVSTSGTGNAGSLVIKGNREIRARNIELSGFNDFGRSGLFANAIVESGNGGNITLNSDRITLKNGATISVGNFTTNTDREFTPGTGTAGDLIIDANVLELDSSSSENFSSISASTHAQAGGNITLNVDSDISLSNHSRIAANSRGEGDGGNITISAKELNLNNQAEVSVNSTGQAQAGNITIAADNLTIDEGKITATSEFSGGGDIDLKAELLSLDRNSLISTSVLDSTGGGGNITINSDYIIANNNSDLKADADEGPGGNITITTKAIFFSPDSEATASSEFGVDGVVEINNPDSDKQIGVVPLESDIVDPTGMISSFCSTASTDTMIVSGKGGLGENPSQTLRGQSVWEDLRDFSLASNDHNAISKRSAAPSDRASQARAAQRLLSQTSKRSALQTTSVPALLIAPTASPGQNHQTETIIEANNWVVNDRGNIELISHIPPSFNQCKKSY